MISLWLMILLICILMLLAAPVRLQADFLHAKETLVRVHLSIIGMKRQWHLALRNTPQGLRLVAAGGEGQEQSIDSQKLSGGVSHLLYRMLLKNAPARKHLLRHARLEQLDAALQIHLDNAAHTALLTGLARALTVLTPVSLRDRTHLRVTPDFIHNRTVLQARCILHFRLGTIIMTAGLLASAAIRRALRSKEAV